MIGWILLPLTVIVLVGCATAPSTVYVPYQDDPIWVYGPHWIHDHPYGPGPYHGR